MTASKRAFLLWWIGGLVAFGIVIWLGSGITGGEVTLGILDHQAAGTAARVDEIQQQWLAGGVLDLARIAMAGDLVFIGIYGIGCVLAGVYYRSRPQIVLKVFGLTALVAGVLFLATDYGETIAQFIQLMELQGDDDLAGFAATLRPVKVFAFIAATLAVIGALLAERLSSRAS
ncbi:hypothetical protein NAP1_06645 [Erythrobacter sp. NAP1]|uniref:hypothetical protein n=1 Tax=Erythrobacter sp. NAP1 TaxID=237727 RepID=UPI0000686C90|nr:hypothetical protein [Erythrobacter sp. NAP1]EAQ30435.1 hypothetical protein NAP1_06645 [Erythrobacter sp. NAP1]